LFHNFGIGVTDQSHENIFRVVCGPWAIMSIHVPPNGFRHIRHCGPFAGSNRAATIHNIRHATNPAGHAGGIRFTVQLSTALQKTSVSRWKVARRHRSVRYWQRR
jgi:hypothetical protein